MRARSPSLDVAVDIEGDSSWTVLSRMAFATSWDPESAVAWDEPIDRDRTPAGWITILHRFYEGEWQGLEIIQRLMNRAAHRFDAPEMITYYSTQCYDESKHLFAFRRYLDKLGAPPVDQKSFDILVAVATRGPLAVERWILATYFTETLAAAIFQRALQVPAVDDVGKAMIRLMLKDESRHIAGTRTALRVLLARTGRVKMLLLTVWWRLFLVLAVREARKLGAHGRDAGIEPEGILRDTLARMRQMADFSSVFLRAKFVENLFGAAPAGE